MMRNNGTGKRKGQTMVETAMILLPVMAVLIGTMDFGQLLFTHQALVERVRYGLRYGTVRPFNATEIQNRILYMQSTVPAPLVPPSPYEQPVDPPGYMGLTRANISVIRVPAPIGDPNEEYVRIAIVEYTYNFLSPWIAKKFKNNRAVVETAPMAWKP